MAEKIEKDCNINLRKENKLKNIEDFIYQKENIGGTEVLTILGIPYAKAQPFGMPQMIETYENRPINRGIGLRFPQRDVPPLINRFLKNPMMRKEILTNGDKTDQDAFVLNIWTNTCPEKKPVLVFIHGGGFTYGSGTTPLYNGKYLASKGLVVVTINYRLGVSGFVPVIDENGHLNANRALYDQQCALKWIRKNISNFGGDEDNITLMGQSAGGFCVSSHMMNKESSKYFDKLIVCSAGLGESMTKEEAIRTSDKLLKDNNLSSYSELVNLPFKKLIKLKIPLDSLAKTVIDGNFFKDDARVLMEKGDFLAKPVMLGTTGDEMEMINIKSWYKALNIVKDEEALYEKSLKLYGPEGKDLVEALYDQYKDPIKVQFKMIEMPFHATALEELKHYCKKDKSYGYRMNFVPNLWNGLRGSYHCADLLYIFGMVDEVVKNNKEDNLKEMELIQKDWIEFIKKGSISNRQAFNESGKITLYQDLEARPIDFPHRDLIEKLQDSGLFKKIMESFMTNRDNKSVA